MDNKNGVKEDPSEILTSALLRGFAASANENVRRGSNVTPGIKPAKPEPTTSVITQTESNKQIIAALTACLYCIDDLSISMDLLLYSSKGGISWLDDFIDITTMVTDSNKSVDLKKVVSFINKCMGFYIPHSNIERRLFQAEKKDDLLSKHLPLLSNLPNDIMRQRGNEILEKEVKHTLLLGSTRLARIIGATVYGNSIGAVHRFTELVCAYFLKIQNPDEIDPWIREENDLTRLFGEWHQAISTQNSFIESAYATKIKHFGKESLLGEAVLDHPITEIYYRLTSDPSLWEYLQNNVVNVLKTTNDFRKSLMEEFNDTNNPPDYIKDMYKSTITKEGDSNTTLFTEYIDFALSSLGSISKIASLQDRLSTSDTDDILLNSFNYLFSQMTGLEPDLHTDFTNKFMQYSEIKKDSWMAQCFPRVDIYGCLTMCGIPHITSISCAIAGRRITSDIDAVAYNTSFLKSVLESRSELVPELYQDTDQYNEHINEEAYVDGMIYQCYSLNGNSMGGDSKIAFGHLDNVIDDVASDNLSGEVTSVLEAYIKCNKSLKDEALKTVPLLRREMEEAMLADIQDRSKMNGYLARKGRTCPESIDDLPVNIKKVLKTSEHFLKTLKLMKTDILLSGLLAYVIFEEIDDTTEALDNTEIKNINNKVKDVGVKVDPTPFNTKRELQNTLTTAHEFLKSIGLTLRGSDLGSTVIYTQYTEANIKNDKNTIGEYLSQYKPVDKVLSTDPSWVQIVKHFTANVRRGGELIVTDINNIKNAVDPQIGFKGVHSTFAHLFKGDTELDFAIAQFLHLAARFRYLQTEGLSSNNEIKYTLQRAYTIVQHFRLRWALDIGFGHKAFRVITRLSTLYGHREGKIMFDAIASLILDTTGFGTGVNEWIRGKAGLTTRDSLSIENAAQEEVTAAGNVFKNIHAKLIPVKAADGVEIDLAKTKTNDIFVESFIKRRGSEYTIEIADTEIQSFVEKINLSDIGYGKLTDEETITVRDTLKQRLFTPMEAIFKNLSGQRTTGPEKGPLIELFRRTASMVTPNHFAELGTQDWRAYNTFNGPKNPFFNISKPNIEKFKLKPGDLEGALKDLFTGDDLKTMVKNLTGPEGVGESPVLIFLNSKKSYKIIKLDNVNWTEDIETLDPGYELLNMIAPVDSSLRARTINEILYSMADDNTKLGSSLKGYFHKVWISYVRAKANVSFTEKASLITTTALGGVSWLSRCISDHSALSSIIALAASLGITKLNATFRSVPTSTLPWTAAMVNPVSIDTESFTKIGSNIGAGLGVSLIKKIAYPVALSVAEFGLVKAGISPHYLTMTIGYLNMIPFIFLILVIFMAFLNLLPGSNYIENKIEAAFTSLSSQFSRRQRARLSNSALEISERGSRAQKETQKISDVK